MQQLLESLRSFDALRDSQVDGRHDSLQTRTLNKVDPRFDTNELRSSLAKDALGRMGISKLYAHQGDAIRAIQQHQDVVIVAPTASGKTLCFDLPMLVDLSKDPDARALLVYPMKALANDQRGQLERLTSALGAKHVESWMYDGDVDPETRKLIRESPPQILLTNPEFLHESFLAHSGLWSDYLSNLKYLVIDEIHEYRGFFGTNAALLFRRFLYKLAKMGVKPRIVLASATCANPAEHARRLTGLAPILIRESEGMRPTRHYAFIDPNIPDYRFPDIFRLRIARASLACMSNGLTSIVFCPTRKFVEDVTLVCRREAAAHGLNPDYVVPYRSGYTAEDRRSIERGLKDGNYKIVFSTNALEIGIDIGLLDVCILAGFPDNVMSAWQRVGRAGRSFDKDAYVLYFAQNNPVDRFYARNLDAFLDRPLDEITIGIDNEVLIDNHLPCVLFESGGFEPNGADEILGEAFLNKYREKSKNYRPPMRRGNATPHRRCPIRSVGGSTWRLMHGQTEIGTVSDRQFFRECYVGAIYNHFGRTYKVAAHGGGEVFLESADPKHRTEPKFYSVAKIQSFRVGRRWHEALATYSGDLMIYDNFAGYTLVDENGSTIDDVREQKAVSMKVRAFWLSFETTDPNTIAQAKVGIRGLEQLLRIGAPFVIPCDRHDLGSLSDLTPPITAYIHETVPGGIGLADKLYDVWKPVLEVGMKIARDCDCADGCPRCIHANRYDRDIDSINKTTALKFCETVLAMADGEAIERFDAKMQTWQLAGTEESVPRI